MKKMKKQDFKKLAWKGVAAGIILASNASAHQIADVNSYSNLLAANCSGNHGCGHSQNSMSQSSYNPQNNAVGSNAPSSGCGAQMNSNGFTAYNPPAQNCGAAAGHPTKYYYTDNQGKWVEGQPPQEYTNVPANPYQDQKMPMGSGQSTQGYQNSSSYSNRSADVSTTNGMSQTMTESSLSSQLNAQTRAIFERMTPEGKALSLKLANQYTDKNEAVLAAAKVMADKRANATSAPKY